MTFRAAVDQMKLAADRECARFATRQKEIDDRRAEADRLLADARDKHAEAVRVKQEAETALEREKERMTVHGVKDIVDLDCGGSHIR